VDVSSGGGFGAHHSCYFSPSNNRVISYALTFAGDRAAEIVLGQGTLDDCRRGFDMTPNGRYLVMSTADLWPPGALVFENSAGRNPFVGDTDGASDIVLIENPLWNAPPTNVAAVAAVPAGSRNVQVSADGRKTVFESDIEASAFDDALVDENGAPDVFEFDADSGEIVLLSTLDGTNALPGGGVRPSMSQNGKNVVFEALDNGLAVPNLGSANPVSYGGGHRSIFLRNQLTGTRRVSAPSLGGAPDGSSMNPGISPGGRFVVFGTDASNVNPTADNNGRRDVVRVDLETGARECISHCPGSPSDGDSDQPSVSDRGDVAWSSDSLSLQKHAGLSKASSARQVFLRYQLTGRSQALSVTTAAVPGNAASERPQISGNGGTVVFESAAGNLPDAGTDGRRHVYLFQQGQTLLRRLSRGAGPGGKQAKLDGDSGEPRLSADGRFVVFQSAASNLVVQDLNGVADLFVLDLRRNHLQRIADAFGGAEPNGPSGTPYLNRNGTRIGFQSQASNFDESGQGAAPLGFVAPLLQANPAAKAVIFADPFD
jgi:Tol biopolymer transport system component